MLDLEGPSRLSLQLTLLWLVHSICLLFCCCYSARNFASTLWLSLRAPPVPSVPVNSEACWALFPHSSPYLLFLNSGSLSLLCQAGLKALSLESGLPAVRTHCQKTLSSHP